MGSKQISPSDTQNISQQRSFSRRNSLVEILQLQDVQHKPSFSRKISIIELEDLKEGVYEDGDCNNPMDPDCLDWLDVEKMRRGQAFAKKHKTFFKLSLNFVFIVALGPENLHGPIAFTHETDDPIASMKRYNATFRHMQMYVHLIML